jgi:hypothetical protein
LTQAGSDVRATVTGAFVSGSVDFTPRTGTAAFVAPSQSFTTFAGSSPVAAGAGALAFAGDGLFLALVDQGLHPTTGFVDCQTAPVVTAPPTSPLDAWPVASFGSCASSAGDFSSGGGGLVTLSQAGGMVTVTLSGTAATGVLSFVAAPGMTGVLATPTSLTVQDVSCGGGGLPASTTVPLAAAQGALVLESDSVFVDLVGSTPCKPWFPVSIACAPVPVPSPPPPR